MCDHFTLRNDRLSVEISYPGKKYCGSRFDWMGFITQVTLDKKHTFCVPESLEKGKGSGGCGLCGEFGIHEPVGYDETPVGGYFHKIGIGLLKKPDMQPYDFFRKYEVMPADSSVFNDRTSADLSLVVPVHNGYGYIYRKSIGLGENQLKITYFLTNTGDKSISTTEYCHNFIGIDNNSIGSSYSLKLPCRINMSEVRGPVNTDDNIFFWPDGFCGEFYCQLSDYKKEGFSWEVYDSKAGSGIRETDDFTIQKFALWGCKHVVSPEAFIKINLEPGASQSWSREYEFF